IDREIVLLGLDGGLEAAGQLDELRRGPRVHAEGIHDLRLALDHGHNHPASVARASSTSPRRTPVIRARNDHSSANPPAATPMSASPEVNGSQPAHTSRSPSEPSGPHNAVRSRSTCSGGTPSCSARAAAPTASPHRYGCALKKCAPRATADR